MPAKTTRSIPKSQLSRKPKIKEGSLVSDPAVETQMSYEAEHSSKNKRKIIFSLIILALLVVAGLGYFFKEKFVVAFIDGKPIFRYEFSQRLASVFGKETLENMIVEKLIKDEAKRKAVLVSGEDINKELEKLGKSLGEGMKLEDALKLQGVSMAEFKKQLELRLQVNRILEKEVSITPEEIDKYIKENVKVLVATGEAERKAEAQERLKEQKISERVQTWINELLKKAKITRLLK